MIFLKHGKDTIFLTNKRKKKQEFSPCGRFPTVLAITEITLHSAMKRKIIRFSFALPSFLRNFAKMAGKPDGCRHETHGTFPEKDF